MKPKRTAEASPLMLRGPADAVAAVPHLLGFVPHESLVAIWVREGAVALTQRVDLPQGQAPGDLARELITTAARTGPTGVLLVVATGQESTWATDASGLPFKALVDDVVTSVQDAGLQVLDALVTDRNRYRSYLCSGDCCPQQGHEIALADVERMEMGFDQSTPDRRRGELEAEWAVDVEKAALVEPLIEEWEGDRHADVERAVEEARHLALESWRDAQLEALEAVSRGNTPVDPAGIARMLVGLSDVRVRDTFVWQLGQRTIDDAVREQLAEALRCAPPGYAAPVATVLALACWQGGDGARAVIALDRALIDDPDYRLAHLAAESIGSGVPPAAWQDLLRGMARDACRRPSGPGSPWVGESV